MSPLEWALVALAVAVLVAGLLIVAAVRQTGVHLRNLPHLNTLSSHTYRIALAAEKAADDRPAQRNAEHYKDMSEKLIIAITTVLNHDLEHPEGLKDDVIIGRNQAAEALKNMLQDELTNAQK